jgi:ribosomal protein S18 acetylase RimI-like enzyme
MSLDVKIRRLREEDLPAADHIMRVAFGTFMGDPNPSRFGEGTDHVKTRWRSNPEATFGAEVDGKLVGSNFVTRLGSFGFFGPLTVHPDYWDKGVAKQLLQPTMELFSKWGVSHAALFTLPNSTKHLGLYQKFGFWPRFLTIIMSKPVQSNRGSVKWSRFSDVAESERNHHLAMCRNLTDTVYKGLDLEAEIVAVQRQELGDTIFLWAGDTLAGVAVCHCGVGTEAGSETCYVKFGLVGGEFNNEDSFDKLLGVCEEVAALRGMSNVVAGVNTACEAACRRMIARGYRIDFPGVMMLSPSDPAFDRPDRYVICDLR